MRIKALFALVVCVPTVSWGQAVEDDRIIPFWEREAREREALLTPLPLDGLQAVCTVRARWFGELEELLGEVRISDTSVAVAGFYLDMIDLCWPPASDVETCAALSERFRDRGSSLSSILRATTYAKAGLDLKCWGGQ